MSVHVCTLNLLNLVIAASDPKDIRMNCPDVTLRYIKSHLYPVVFISTCNVLSFFTFVFIIILHELSISTVYMYVCYV